MITEWMELTTQQMIINKWAPKAMANLHLNNQKTKKKTPSRVTAIIKIKMILINNQMQGTVSHFSPNNKITKLFWMMIMLLINRIKSESLHHL